MNHVCIEMTRYCILHAKDNHLKLMTKVLVCTFYIINHYPKIIVKGITPKEEKSGRKLYVLDFKVFGYDA